jgi:sec-independent protein translocase protein TatB
VLDVSSGEFLLVAVIALVVIGPKDLPKVLRVVGKWVGKARNMAQQFRSGFDDMIRESELKEMEAKWRAENDRIMRENPALTQGESTPLEVPAAPAPPKADG